jgi:L-fuconolactonase
VIQYPERPFRGNRIRSSQALADWHAQANVESALEPDICIVDAHHHLYGNGSETYHYLPKELKADIDSGHNIVATVYVEAYQAGWREDGPAELRSTGEVERIVRITSNHGWEFNRVASAIVSFVDLTAGDKVSSVLEAHLHAAQGRLRGVRQQATWDGGTVGRYITNAPIPKLLNDRRFMEGFARLREHGLSFDAAVYHTQLMDVAHLADAFPDVPIVLNHLGMPIGVEDFGRDRSGVFDRWRESMREVSLRSNVYVKIGGLGMAVHGFGFDSGRSPANSTTLAEAWRPFILTCIDTFEPDRCMFESNFPVDKQSCSYVALWNAYKIATRALSRSERENLFARTAARVYRLPQLPV